MSATIGRRRTWSRTAAAGASAIIAYLPALAGWRVPLALTLVVVVGRLMWFGHVGRAAFATLTVAFIVLAVTVLGFGLNASPLAERRAWSSRGADGNSRTRRVLTDRFAIRRLP